MNEPLQKLRWERQRKLQVRQAFSAGLEHDWDDDGHATDFYLACADYLIPGQYRLVDQDLRLAKLLQERVPADQREDHEAIGALIGRLERGRAAADAFAAAAGQYRTAGPAGRAGFEAAARVYLDVIVNVLGARSHSLRHLTSTLMSDDDWVYMADMSPEFVAEEEELFRAVQRAGPAQLDPDGFSTSKPAAG